MAEEDVQKPENDTVQRRRKRQQVRLLKLRDKEDRVRISLRLEATVDEKLDQLAELRGLDRNTAISVAIAQDWICLLYTSDVYKRQDSVLPVEPTILEHIRVAVARAVQAEREVDRLRAQTTPPPENREQATRLDSISEQVAMLTAKLNAAESQISQAEARAARAEAQLAQTLETVRSMKQTALSAEDALDRSQRERGRLLEQVATLRQEARFPTAPKAVASGVESPTAASKPAPVQPSSAAAPPAPTAAKPATVPMEQSVTRAAAQAVPLSLIHI